MKILELNHIKVSWWYPATTILTTRMQNYSMVTMLCQLQTITPENFKSLYADFGYRNAIARDPVSLSYVSEPFKGLRILALDANEYYNNTPDYCVVAGNIKDETMEWAKEQLADAQASGNNSHWYDAPWNC